MWAGNLVTARLLARKGIVDPANFNSIIAKKLEGNGSGGGGGGGGGDTPSADNYTWEGVAYHINNGTYRDVYAIGDSIPLDLGSEGVINMQIAAFDVDTLADGSGKAPVTFVAMDLLQTSVSMITDSRQASQGWGSTALRTTLQNTIKPLIPQNVQNRIVEVTKKSGTSAYNLNNKESVDSVWVPSREEVTESYGAYFSLYPDATSRIKYKSGADAPDQWWTRGTNASAYSSFAISTDGSVVAKSMGQTAGVCLCFCLGKSK